MCAEAQRIDARLVRARFDRALPQPGRVRRSFGCTEAMSNELLAVVHENSSFTGYAGSPRLENRALSRLVFI